ncbi:MAG TPA: DNA double-strand break repair nuclease NurA [Nitrososphaera sp.]|nr:DNA double-strand break repair nuclease NurA [Nitrososphaera sp.]
MLNEVFLDALKNRDAKISKVKDSNFAKILAEASSRWVPYEPSPEKCESAGIDSSWNKRALQGLHLYVVDAVAVTSANKILAAEWDHDIAGSARADFLESKAMAMEASVAQKAAGKVDIVCVDGSLISRLLKSAAEAASEMVRKCGTCIFVSKSSESRLQFGNMGSRAGDVYYYGHAGKGAGFSVPVETQFRHAPLYEVYARLRDHTPMIRIEVLGATSNQEITKILDKLRHHSVAGYPYCLKLAHNTCKISNEDIDRLASIFSLQHEQGARDALNE